MEDTDDEATTFYQRSGTGEATESRGRRSVTMLGLAVHTDRWGLLALLEQIRFDAETIDEAGDDEKPDPTTLIVNRFDEFYPGLKEAVVRGIKEVESRRVRAGHIVFLNGQVQVWPEKQFAHVAPSDFYPTQCLDAPGYEGELEKAAKAREAAAQAQHEATMRQLEDEFVTALNVKPDYLLENIRSLAVHYKRLGLTEGPLTSMIRKHVVPWLAQSEANRAQAEQILGPVHHRDGKPAGAQDDCRWILEA